MPSMGIQIGAQVAQEILAKRLKRQEEEEAKATKGQSQVADQPKPGSYGGDVRKFQDAMQAPGYPGGDPGPEFAPGGQYGPDEPEQLSGPGMGFDMTPRMGMSVYGSGKFSEADIKRGYRSLGKA